LNYLDLHPKINGSSFEETFCFGRGGSMPWEYKVVEMITLEPAAIERRLMELGKINWELISYFSGDRGAGMAVLKRPIRESRDRRTSGLDRRQGPNDRRKPRF
jgi:hypothetical protein